MKNPRLYIAYGSNTNLKQIAFRCPTAKTVGTAIVNDFRLLFRGNDGSAVATIEPKEGSEVPVAVWRLKEKDEIALDRYEGYPSFYRKGMLNIEINGKQTAAMVYFMNEGYPIGTPSENYFHTIQVGYEDNGLDMNVLLSALDFSDRMSQLDKHMRANWQQLEMDSNDHVDYDYHEPDNDDIEYDEPDFDEPGFELKM